MHTLMMEISLLGNFYFFHASESLAIFLGSIYYQRKFIENLIITKSNWLNQIIIPGRLAA